MTPDALLAFAPRVRAERDDVHIWPFLLDGAEPARAQCESLLSQRELERARRFHYEHLRVAFVFAHGLMRHVLGAYCQREPATLEFVAGEFGKPMLNGASAIAFNLSHSHGRALLAVSPHREVGVDIEQKNERTNVLGIASSYFCGPELEAIQRAPAELRTETFFRYWAAKEAVLKAEGVGLHVALDSFQVNFEESLQTASVESRPGSKISPGWRVRRLPCEEGWFAAVAARGEWRTSVASAGGFEPL